MSQIKKNLVLHSGNSKAGVRAPVCVMAAALIKLAKHLALLSCALIAGSGAGRGPTSSTAIFFLILFAAVIHAVGRRFERRLLALHPLPLRGP